MIRSGRVSILDQDDGWICGHPWVDGGGHSAKTPEKAEGIIGN